MGDINLASLFLNSVHLAPLAKQNGAICPVGIPSVLVRLVGFCLTHSARDASAHVLIQHGQLGLAVLHGVEKAIHAIQHAVATSMSSNSASVTALLDLENAFNRLNRNKAMHTVIQFLPELAPYVDSLYSTSSHAFLRGAPSVSIEAGVIQGENFGSLLFALVLHILNMQFLATLGVPDAAAVNLLNIQIMDDVTLSGPPHVVAAFIAFLHDQGPQLGLFLSRIKTKVYPSSPEAERLFWRSLDERTSDTNAVLSRHSVEPLHSVDGFSTLGAAFNCNADDYADNFVATKLAGPTARKQLNKLAQLDDAQIAYHLLYKLLAYPMSIFYARTHPPLHLPTTLNQ
jgi:hypothetical protein